jgi:autotransporter-associated beta strand protein
VGASVTFSSATGASAINVNSGTKTVGAITINSNFAYTFSGSQLNLDNGGTATISVTGSATHVFSNNIQLTNSNLVVSGSGSAQFNGVISQNSGSRSLTMAGTGLLTLAANNTYAGTTTVSSGTLRITNAGALGTTAAGTTVQSGGELQLSGGITVTGESLTLSGTGTNGALVSQSGTNSWDGNIALAADATITNLTGNRFSIGVYNSTPSSNSDLTLAGNTVTFNAASSGEIRVATDIVGSGNVVIASTGSGTVEYYSTGNTFTGTTTINSGTLSLYTDSSGPGNFVVGDGTGTDTLIYNSLNDQIGDSATVRVNRSGVLNLNNRSDTIGALTLEGGISAGTGLVTTGTGTLTLNGDVTLAYAAASTQSAEISGKLNLGGGTRIFDVANSSPDVDLLVSAVISEPYYSSVTKTGTGTLQFSAANTYTGETRVNAGVLRVSNAAALGAANYNNYVASGAALEFAGSFTLNESGLTLAGSGIAGNGALRSISGTNAYNNQLAIDAAGASVGVDSGASLSLGGQINGGDFAKVGAGTLTLTGTQEVNASTFIVNGGTTVLNRTASGNLVKTAVNVQSGVLRLAANDQIANSQTITFASAGTFDLAGFNETVGKLAFTGGAVTLGGGTLTLNADPAIISSAAATSATIAGAGALNLGAYAATFQVADGTAVNDLDISSVISGSSILHKTGDGALRLDNAANSYSGGTVIDGGTVRISPSAGSVGIATAGTNSYLGTGALTVNTGGTLEIAPTGSGADFTGFDRALTINGGTVRLAPQNEATGLMLGTNTLTFGSAGGLLDIDQQLAAGVNLGNVQVNAASGTPATVRYGTISNPSGTGGWDSGGRDLNIANGSLTGTGHLGFELLNGAAVQYNQASFGGTLYFSGPTTGDPSASTTATTTGRLALDTQSTFTVAGGINFDGIMQVGLYGAARTLDADITVRSGTTAFQGRGTNSAALDALTIGSTVNGRSLIVEDGARAVMDIGYRDDVDYNGGIVLNAKSDIRAGGTLEFAQTNTANSFSTIQVYGNVVGSGTTGHEATLRLSTPVGSLPGSTAGTTYFDNASKIIVNGAGTGGLRVEGTKARVDAYATDARLAATTGTGGTLTLAYTSGGDRALGSAANLTVASAVNLGLVSSGGEFTLTGSLANWGGLLVGDNTKVTFGNSNVFDSADTLTLNTGSVLNLAGTTQSFGTLNVVGDSVIDFSSSSASTLNVNSLNIASGVTLTLVNWVSTVDYFFANLDPGSANLNNVVFAYNGETGSWSVYGLPNEITPAPEPSVYGAVLIGSLLGWMGLRRRAASGRRRG